MNLNTIAGLPSLTSTGVYSLDSTLDPPGMDVWLAPAPAQQTLVDADTSFQREAEGRAGSPLMGMGKDDWGNLFGGAGVGGGNSFGMSAFFTDHQMRQRRGQPVLCGGHRCTLTTEITRTTYSQLC